MAAGKLKFDVSTNEERTLFPVAIATCVVLIATLLIVFVVRDRSNLQEAQAEAATVRAVLAETRSAFADEVRAFAERLPPREIAARTGASGPVHLTGTVGEAFVVDLARDFAADAQKGDAASLAPLFAAVAPAAKSAGSGALRGAMSELPFAARWGLPETIAALAGARPYFVSLTPYLSARENDGNLALLVARRVDERMLAEIARVADTSRIDIVDRPSSDENFASARLDAGETSLAWRPKRPGDEIVEKIATFLLAFASIFAALIVFHSRRVTRELVTSEAQAKAVVGQDILTGLPNRFLFSRLLDSEVERVKRSVNERGLAVLFIDLDRFKEINDTYGHEAGDQLIVGFTRRVATLLRSSGRLARMGGDEFAILQTEVVGPRDAEILARRIFESLGEPFDLDGQKVYASVSIGIVLCPHDADSADELTRRADLALYRAKNEGRNRYCFFEQKMGEQLKLRKTVEDDLRQAIEDGALLVQYQPVMEISGERMVGVEALVRWPHPTHGLISPTNFITLAEECGLILPLGEWVLRRALHDVRQWPGLRVAVNVSGIQFRHKDFVSMLERLLKETGVDPSQLELELTESILLADADSAENAMIDLRAMGVRLALDDFGTGYSSLIYLRRFAFDKIKIDKSFLDSMESTGESAIIVHSIVHLGRALGLTVTAEGIETTEQHRFLQALGCHELQGYLFSRPVSALEITQRLMRQSEPAADPDAGTDANPPEAFERSVA